MKACSLSLILYICILINFCQSRTLRIQEMQCQSLDPSFSYYKTCKVVHKDNGRALLYVNHVILYGKPMDDIIINLSIFKLFKIRRYQLMNETLDYCAFSRNIMLATGIIGFMITPLLKISNINATCPLQQKSIAFNGFPIDENTLKEIPIPSGRYLFQLKTAINKKWKSVIKTFVNRVD